MSYPRGWKWRWRAATTAAAVAGTLAVAACGASGSSGGGPALAPITPASPHALAGFPGTSGSPSALPTAVPTAILDPPAIARAGGARRTFLRTATAGAAMAGAAVAGAGVEHVLTSRTPSPVSAGVLEPRHGVWLTAVASADLPEGAVRAFTVGAITGFIQRTNGQLRAVSGICTHQGCRLSLAARPARLVCPCHGATFTLDGAVLTHRFPIPLAALPSIEVREANGAVQVYAPRPTP